MSARPAAARAIAAPATTARDAEQPLSALLRQQIEETFAELKRHHPEAAAALEPVSVTTQEESAVFMKRAIEVLQPSAVEKPARPKQRARRSTRRSR
jgi:hypothetical protein